MSWSLVVDAHQPSRLAEFWAAAIPGYRVRPYDDEEIARLAGLGFTPETDPSVPIDGDGPTIWFQRVDSQPQERNRLHIDLNHAPRDTEAARLSSLGATVHLKRADHIVMLDPEGNQFCLFDP